METVWCIASESCYAERSRAGEVVFHGFTMGLQTGRCAADATYHIAICSLVFNSGKSCFYELIPNIATRSFTITP